jgi:rod shape determining protein RodA
MSRLLNGFRSIDWWLAVPTIYLLVLSFVIQYSILSKTKGADIDYNLLPHVGAVVGAIIVVFVASLFKPNSWLKTFRVVYVLSLLALLVLLATGGEDVARWLNIGGFRFQPTEIIKLCTIGVVAGFVAASVKANDGFRTIFGSLALVGIPAILIALQPSLGSALVFAAIWGLMMLASPVRLSRLAVIGLTVIVVLAVALPLLKPYQQDRISSFLSPGDDSRGTSYNSIQAGIAIGSGGLLGRGLDSGSQSQLNFLPAQHTDFVFAVTAEKLGLIGALSIIVALTALMLRMTFLAWMTGSMYLRLLLIGIVGMLLTHAVVNVGMNIGILPVTGLPLPFVSYGGTFFFICLLSVGLSMIISHHITKK